MDRFHPIPDVPARAASWAEWLYFNGRSGDTRFYLTFLAGPRAAPGRRVLGVRLQLERGGPHDVLRGFVRGGRRGAARVGAGSDGRIEPSASRGPGLSHRARSARRVECPSRHRPTCRCAPRPDDRSRRSSFAAPQAGSPVTRCRSCPVALEGSIRVDGQRHRSDRRYRLSRSQLGLLGRCALAVGSGPGRRPLLRLRPRPSACRCRGRAVASRGFSPRSARTVQSATRRTSPSTKSTIPPHDDRSESSFEAAASR